LTAYVALESTVLAHGLPYPFNLELSNELEAIVSSENALAQTVGIIDGQIRCSLTREEIERMCFEEGVRKVSIKDIPICMARGWTGATTVAATIRLARRQGMRVMATGGIGGIHRGTDGSPVPDESADLSELAANPMTVVCAGPKAVLHLEATRERLETLGITVLGWKTDSMPAFYCGSSDHVVDARCDTIAEVAQVVRSRDELGSPQAILLCVPLSDSIALDYAEVSNVVEDALASEPAEKLLPNEITPFLLTRVREALGDRALEANLEILRQNARIAAQISVELVRQS